MTKEELKKMKKRRGWDKGVRRFWTLLFFLSLAGASFCFYMLFFHTSTMPRNTDVTPYTHILTNEEQEEWQTKKVVPGEGFLQINLIAPLGADKKTAELRLINPPYSDFAVQVKIHLVSAPDRLIYQSEVLYPGTVVFEGQLLEPLPEGDHEAIAVYTFLDENGKNKADYSVHLVFSFGQTPPSFADIKQGNE